MKISLDTVKKVSRLANLPLNESEEEKLSDQLSKILDYIDQLSKLETTNTESKFNIIKDKNITQQDVVRKSLTQNDATQNKQSQDGFFVTKGVFSDE